MNVFVAILGLAFLVLVHESGHFVVARLVGMNPRKFYLGFQPAIVKRTRNGIEYGIGAIPLGGYVKIPGMYRPAARDAEIWFGSACEEAPELVEPVHELRRALERGDYAATRKRIGEVDAMIAERGLSPAAMKAARRGVEEISDASAPDAYWRAGTWKRLAVIFAGPAVNILAAALLFACSFAFHGGDFTNKVSFVEAGRPAERAGFDKGDRILAIAGRAVTAEKITNAVNASKGKPFTITLEKSGGRTTTVTVTAQKRAGRYRIGFGLTAGGQPIPAAAWRGVKETGIVTKEIAVLFAHLVKGENAGEFTGIVGVVRESSAVVEQGFGYYLGVLGLISLSLALINLLPLLPLDGGHILFSLIEGVRRKAVPRDVYERVSAVGIALVLFVCMLTLTNDIGWL